VKLLCERRRDWRLKRAPRVEGSDLVKELEYNSRERSLVSQPMVKGTDPAS
jgi:hypothetical protein